MKKLFIQIDNLVREMTDEEYAQHLEDLSNAFPLPDNDTSDA
jgi:hypothetical protein